MGQITLQAPDGTPRTFVTKGDKVTPDEMRTFLKIMKMSNPDPNADAPNPENQAKMGAFDVYDANEIKDNNTASYDFRANTPAPMDAVESSATPFLPNNAQQDTVNTSSMAATATPVGDTIPDVQPEVQSTGPDAPDVAQTQSSENETVISSEQDPTSSQFGPSFESPELEVPQTRDAVSRSTVQVTEPFTPPEDLPPPSSGMFDNLEDAFLSPEEKEQVVITQLNKYITHPRTEQRWDGRHIYTDAEGNNWRVPRIVWNKAGNEAYILDSWFLEGVEDGTKNTVEFAGDVSDFFRDFYDKKTGGDGISNEESYGEAIRNATSQYSEEGRGLRTFGGEVAGVFGVGGPVVKGVRWFNGMLRGGKNVGKLRQGARSLADLGTDAIILQAPISGDSSGLLLGEDAMIKASTYMPILEGLDPDASDAEWAQRLENRRNMILEGGALGGLFKGVVYAGGNAASLVSALTVGSLWKAGQMSVREKTAMNEIMARLIKAENATSDAERKAFMQQFADAMDQYGTEIFTINDSLIQGARIDRTTMNAFLTSIENGDYQNAIQVANRAASIQQGVINQVSGQTAVKAEAAQQALDTSMGKIDDTLGGSSAIDRSRRMIQEGDADSAFVATQSDEIASLSQQLDTLDARLIEEINAGGELSSKLSRLGQLTGLNLTNRSDEAMETVLSRITSAYAKLKGVRQQKYGAVQGGFLDDEGLFNFLRGMEPADLSEAATSLGYAPRLKRMIDAVADRKKLVDGKQVDVPEDELLDDFRNALADADITDYGSLFQNLRANLAVTKSDLFEAGGQGQKSAGRSINDLLKYIDGELLDSTMDRGTVDAVTDAIAWDKDNFIPFFKDQDTALGRVANLYDNKIEPTLISGTQRTTSFDDLATQAITDNLSRRTRANAQAIVNLLQRPEAGGTDELIDYVLFETLQPISASLRVGGTAPNPQDLLKALNDLSTYETVIRTANPKLADELDAFGRKLEDGTFDRDDLAKRLEQATNNRQAALERINEGALQDFFSAQGIPIEDGLASYQKLFKNFTTGSNNTGRLRVLAEQFQNEAAMGNPWLLEGMQAAYIKEMRNAIITKTDGLTQSGGTSKVAVKNVAQDRDKWFEGLDIVFADRPEAALLIRDLFARSGDEAAMRNVRPLSPESATAGLQEKIKAFNTIVTVVYGNLSRFGARLRRGGSAVIEKTFNKSAYETLTDEILADPQRAKRIVEALMKDEFEQGFTAQTAEAAINALVYAGMFGPEDAEEAAAMNYEIIAATAAAEANVREYTNDGRTFIGNIWQQTKDAFSEQFLQ